MRPEDRLLLICSRREFEAEHRQSLLSLCQRNQVKWDEIWTMATRHGVAPLVYAHLASCPAETLGIPHSILTRFRSLFARNLMLKARRADRLAQVLEMLNSRRIDAMLIKGAALDMLVYAPWAYTTSRDVDLVLRVGREELAEVERGEIASAMGAYDIEYDFFEHHDLTLNGILPIDFKRIWAEAKPARYHGESVWLMRPEDLVVAACINACRHHFLRLKNLCDIAESIRAFPMLNWAEATRIARAQACGNIVYTALQLTQHTLGCEVPAAVLDDLGVHAARRALVDVICGLVLRLPWTATTSGLQVAGRWVQPLLLLTYAAYDRQQVRRKLSFLKTNWTGPTPVL